MAAVPESVAAFLKGKRIVVAGVSRTPAAHSGNAVFRGLRDRGYDTVPVNPNTPSVEGMTCYPDVASVPGDVDAVVVATHPDVSADIVRQCAARGVARIWFHRSFGTGSVSDDAVRECVEQGLQPIVGGCPLMYAAPDVFHRCARWWLQRVGRAPL